MLGTHRDYDQGCALMARCREAFSATTSRSGEALASNTLIEPAKEGETMSDTVPCEAPVICARIIADTTRRDKTPAPTFTSSTPLPHDPAQTRLRPPPAGSPTPARRHPPARRWGISPLTLTPIQQAVWQVILR